MIRFDSPSPHGSTGPISIAQVMAEAFGVDGAFVLEERFSSEEERIRGRDFLALAWVGSDPNRKVGKLVIGFRGRYVGERIECAMCAVRVHGTVLLGFQVTRAVLMTLGRVVGYKYQQTLNDSFSAVSKPTFARYQNKILTTRITT